MTINEKRVERLLSELSDIEFESQRLLDDDSLRLIAVSTTLMVDAAETSRLYTWRTISRQRW